MRLKYNKSDLIVNAFILFIFFILFYISTTVIDTVSAEFNIMLIISSFVVAGIYLLSLFTIRLEEQTKVCIDNLKYSKLVYKNAVIFIDNTNKYVHIFNYESGNIKKLHDIKYIEVIKIYNRNKKQIATRINPYKYINKDVNINDCM